MQKVKLINCNARGTDNFKSINKQYNLFLKKHKIMKCKTVKISKLNQQER